MKKDTYFTQIRYIRGIYQISNLVNQKIYIGSSETIGKRLSIHRTRLRGNYHPNPHLQHAWNKYGEASFHFTMLDEIRQGNLNEIEQDYMDKLDAYNPDKGYNIRPLANGGMHSETTKQKISQAKKGIPMKEETKQKLSLRKKGMVAPNKGKPMPEHQRQLQIGRKHTPESIEKMRRNRSGKSAWNKGMSMSQEQKEKIRKAREFSSRDSQGRFVPNC